MIVRSPSVCVFIVSGREIAGERELNEYLEKKGIYRQWFTWQLSNLIRTRLHSEILVQS